MKNILGFRQGWVGCLAYRAFSQGDNGFCPSPPLGHGGTQSPGPNLIPVHPWLYSTAMCVAFWVIYLKCGVSTLSTPQDHFICFTSISGETFILKTMLSETRLLCSSLSFTVHFLVCCLCFPTLPIAQYIDTMLKNCIMTCIWAGFNIDCKRKTVHNMKMCNCAKNTQYCKGKTTDRCGLAIRKGIFWVGQSGEGQSFFPNPGII